MFRNVLLPLVAVTLALLGCRDSAPPASPNPPASPAPAPATPAPGLTATVTTNAAATNRIFTVRGVVEQLKENGRIAVIKHEAIPGYMDAMTMPFTVRKTDDLRNLLPGAVVIFKFVVTPEDSWLEDVALLGGAKLPDTPSVRSFRLVRDVEPLKVGDRMPDYRFTNQLGRAVQLADFNGKAYAFTFLFTKCPMPDYCPRMNRNFTNVVAQLKSRADAPGNWHLLSISFDVGFDTPPVLLNHARQLGYDPQRWSFLTGALIDVDAITEQFGLVFRREAGRIDFDHNLRTVVVDATGRVQDIFTGNAWKPEQLVEALVKAAAAKP
jgi:protein SCO1/2